MMEIKLHFEDVEKKRAELNHFGLIVNSGSGSIDVLGLSCDNILHN